MSTDSQRVEHHAADVVAAARVEAGLVGVLLRQAQELPLQLDRGDAPAVEQLDRGAARGVVRHRAHRVDRPDDREVLLDEAVLDHRQHDRGGADLQEGRHLAQVGVARDHVQAAVDCGSAWGSSRVFTIGRFSVVSSPTSSSKKSARWLIW